jgi:hypothetical protein
MPLWAELRLVTGVRHVPNKVCICETFQKRTFSSLLLKIIFSEYVTYLLAVIQFKTQYVSLIISVSLCQEIDAS